VTLLSGDSHQASELVPIADRMRYLQGLRVAVVAAVVAYALLVPDSGLGLVHLLGASGVFIGLAVGAQLAWRLSRAGGVYLFGLTVMLDGVYLMAVSYASGWFESPLSYLVLVHLIAVALLASYRTGLKLALWDSLLLLVLREAQKAELLPAVDGAASASFGQIAALSGAFLVVAGATASFSSVNERELRRRRYDLEALARMARSLEESEGSESAAEVLVSSVADVYDFERAVLLASPGGEALAAMAFQGDVDLGAPAIAGGEASVVDRARARREVELVTHIDATQDPWLDALMPDAHKIAVFPLTVETRSVGVLCVEHSLRRGSRIERRVVSTIERFVSHGALTLHNAWLLERIRELAQTDGLTGVANRDTFDRRLSAELSRAARHHENVSLLMVDVDHFKLLNDAHGHLIGDDVLRRVANQLREACREQDTIARYGGEEFGLVLPNTDTNDALMAADRIRRMVAECDEDPPATISVGVATFPLDAVEVHELVTAADMALYRSKRAGRDRVTAAAVPADAIVG